MTRSSESDVATSKSPAGRDGAEGGFSAKNDRHTPSTHIIPKPREAEARLAAGIFTHRVLTAAGKGERPPKAGHGRASCGHGHLERENKPRKPLGLSQEASFRHPRMGRKLVVC
jgi:hypothetical protein